MIARFLTEEPLAELSSVCQKEEIRTLQEACKEVYLHPELVQYLVRIVQETRVNSKIASGVSPRGTLAFLRAVQGHALVQGRKLRCAGGLQDRGCSGTRTPSHHADRRRRRKSPQNR